MGRMARCGALLQLLLLLAASCLHAGEAFRCFTCEQPTAIHLCKNVTRCKPEATACMTTLVLMEAEYPFNQMPLVTRSCSNSCFATDPDSMGSTRAVYCCFRDLCNSVQATKLRVRALAPLGAPLLP
ncbi:secreted Ly-6/uPAR-related protein 1 [Neofelis nebulosa]|uniref:secreted Ly-6/uPAR-related protein 1 n=1 Tax=Neofelis nebulosa TaxID=61452 RepID=UPI00272BACC9|nr:secreted Ly-6/uPAR-related protein 1 [Neofelis nebulosa]